jgi:hypothetical protein
MARGWAPRVIADEADRVEDLDQLAESLVVAAESANGEPLADDVAILIVSASGRWRR